MKTLAALSRKSDACILCYRHTPLATWISQSPYRRQISMTASRREEIHASQQSTEKPPLVPYERPLTEPSSDGEINSRVASTQAGSRRRRAALAGSANIPFELLPYQCFQEARKLLQEDRRAKIMKIDMERARIERLAATSDEAAGGAGRKRSRLRAMNQHLERLTVLADINDPMVKKRFEDGEADFNRPVYRFLAEKRWRSQRRMIMMQRLTQMHVIPDVLPRFNATADVALSFGRHKIQPGEFVDSRISSITPNLSVQVFNKGERLITVVVIDSDIPVPEQDTFTHQCLFIATNIPISPTSPSAALRRLEPGTQIVLPWLPPTASKGAPYHRISVFVCEQNSNEPLNAEAVRRSVSRDNFSLPSFANEMQLSPTGAFIFRTQWDDGMEGVMKKFGIDGWDIEYKHRRVEALPKKKKDGMRYR